MNYKINAFKWINMQMNSCNCSPSWSNDKFSSTIGVTWQESQLGHQAFLNTSIKKKSNKNMGMIQIPYPRDTERRKTKKAGSQDGKCHGAEGCVGRMLGRGGIGQRIPSCAPGLRLKPVRSEGSPEVGVSEGEWTQGAAGVPPSQSPSNRWAGEKEDRLHVPFEAATNLSLTPHSCWLKKKSN